MRLSVLAVGRKYGRTKILPLQPPIVTVHTDRVSLAHQIVARHPVMVFFRHLAQLLYRYLHLRIVGINGIVIGVELRLDNTCGITAHTDDKHRQ